MVDTCCGTRPTYVGAAVRRPASRLPPTILTTLALVLTLTAASPDGSDQLAAADAAMQAGRFADAAEQYELLLATHPDAPEVLFALGACYLQLGRTAEAASALRRAMSRPRPL